jgi:hypothetical protein
VITTFALPLRLHRYLSVAVQLAIVAAANAAAFALRFDANPPSWAVTAWLQMLPCLLLVRALTFRWCGLYKDIWGYTGFYDVVAILKPTSTLTLGLNGDYGKENGTSLVNPGSDATWKGIAGYATLALTPKISVALRGETFHDEDGVRLEVEDSGPGVSADDEAKLFQPFFTTKPVGEGTGLGLSVSYGIIRSLGGRIGYRRGQLGGALFFFTVPASGRDIGRIEVMEPAV